VRSRILLADDQKILTEGLATILSQVYEIVATARNGHELVSLAKELNPDLIIAEIALPQLNSLDALQILRKAGLKAKLIVLTMHVDVSLAIAAFRAGVAGYVLKLASKDEVIAAIENALSGRTYLSSGFPVDLVSILSEAVRQSGRGGFEVDTTAKRSPAVGGRRQEHERSCHDPLDLDEDSRNV